MSKIDWQARAERLEKALRALLDFAKPLPAAWERWKAMTRPGGADMFGGLDAVA